MDSVLQTWLDACQEKLNDGLWEATHQGKMLKVRHRQKYVCPRPYGKRKRITTFSRHSRLRQLKLVATVNWQEIPHSLFCTLTYPDEAVHCCQSKRNRERYLFMRYVEGYLGREVPIIWRVEWKPRQSGVNKGKHVPHIHLLILNAKWIPKETLRLWWRTILGVKKALCTHIKRIPSEEIASIYIAKYCAKTASTSTLEYLTYLNSTGRHWGVHRKPLLPLHAPIEFPSLPVDFVVWLQAVASGKLGYYDPMYDEGFTLLGEFAKQIGDKLLKKSLDIASYNRDNYGHQGGS